MCRESILLILTKIYCCPYTGRTVGSFKFGLFLKHQVENIKSKKFSVEQASFGSMRFGLLGAGSLCVGSLRVVSMDVTVVHSAVDH